MTEPAARRPVVLTVKGDPHAPTSLPSTAAEAVALLEQGNAAFARIGAEGGELQIVLSPEAIGLERGPGDELPHEPFAAALGCSDARVPLELILGRSDNEIFVTRVAGNVPGAAVVGSLHYAVAQIPSVKVVAVLGHRNCGAITAAVDAMLSPDTYLQVVHDPPLRSIVDSILASVQLASLALLDAHGDAVASYEGYREALIEISALANAAVSATVLRNDMDREVVFGIYDIATRRIGIPTRSGWRPGLVPPPDDDEALRALLAAASEHALA